jgi:uncharacterized 2Fe-2S/4Fe-4S cluster protein (DUF4445 family)
MKTHILTVRTNGQKQRLQDTAGKRISALLQKYRIPLATPCGGFGTCGKCRIRFTGPAPDPLPEDKRQFSEQELRSGWRLACRHKLTQDTEIVLPTSPEKELNILTQGSGALKAAEPIVDLQRFRGKVYGAAVDLGTSTIALSLFDLRSGNRVKTVTSPNPQRIYGADIITRATAAVSDPDVQQTMRTMLKDRINELLKTCHRQTEEIAAIVLAGNAVMAHLFLGRSLDSLVRAPYTADFTDMQICSAAAAGLLIHPDAKLYLLPAIGSFIGGDISADLLLCSETIPEGRSYLLADLGTNCELVLHGPQGTIAASAPAGPVMEGAGIRQGMLAEAGALTDLFFDEAGNTIPLTIGDQKARGICGSGLIHSIAELRKRGILLGNGRFEKDWADGFMIADGLRLLPEDIRAFQMAKSAIESSWSLLLEENAMEESDLDHVVIAGAFGHYIRPGAGIALGLFPERNISSFIYLGNGSLAGCEAVLLNKDYVERINSIAQRTQHVETGGRSRFQEMYVTNMGLGRHIYEF